MVAERGPALVPRPIHRARDRPWARARRGARRLDRAGHGVFPPGARLAAAAPGHQPGDPGVRARADPGAVARLRHRLQGRDGDAHHLLPGHRRVLRRPQAHRPGLARSGAHHGRQPPDHPPPYPRAGRAAGARLGRARRDRGRADRRHRRRMGRRERRPRLHHAARQRAHPDGADVRRALHLGRHRHRPLLRRRLGGAPRGALAGQSNPTDDPLRS